MNVLGIAAIVVAIFILAGIGVYVWPRTPSQKKRVRIRKLGLNKTTGSSPSLALARTAYDRGDYLRVCELLATTTANDPLAQHLLYADACAELGTDAGDERSVATYEAISAVLEAAWNPRFDALQNALQSQPASVDPALYGWGQGVDELPWRERAILDRFLQQRPNLLRLADALKPPTPSGKSTPPATPTTVVDVLTDARFLWEKLRRQLTTDHKNAVKKHQRWRWTEWILGGLTAGLAAGAGGTALLKGTKAASAGANASGANPVLIFSLSVLSALVAALIIMIAPAKEAEAAQKEAAGLEELIAAIDLYDDAQRKLDANQRDEKLVKATEEVRKRARAAKGLGLPRELV